MSEPFIGEIRLVGFNFEPQGWAFCDGRLLPISTNQALFSLLGTTFGGNGTTTFGLPDLRGRSPVGMGTGPGLTTINQGEMSGNESVTILATQMPMHTHVATGTATLSVAGTSSNPNVTPSATNSVLGASSGGAGSASIWSDQVTNPVALTNPSAVAVTVGVAGGSQPLPVRNPYLGSNFVIALQGIFPSHN